MTRDSEAFQSERSVTTEHEATLEDASCLGEAGEGANIMSIDELQAQGIGMADIQKLRVAGICTVKGVCMTGRRALLKVKGLSEAKVDKIKEACEKLHDSGFISALEFSIRRQVVFTASTGSQELMRSSAAACSRWPSPRSLASFARARRKSA